MLLVALRLPAEKMRQRALRIVHELPDKLHEPDDLFHLGCSDAQSADPNSDPPETPKARAAPEKA